MARRFHFTLDPLLRVRRLREDAQRRDFRPLPGGEQDFLAEGTHDHGRNPGDHRQPQRHAHRAAHLAHRMPAPPQLCRDQRRHGSGQARERPDQQAENARRQARRGQHGFPQPRQEDHVDRIDRHLQQVGDHQRRRQQQRRAQFSAPN